MQSYGVKIDGIGLQDHLIVGSSPSLEDQVTNMKAFTALGLEVAITELDNSFLKGGPKAWSYMFIGRADAVASTGSA